MKESSFVVCLFFQIDGIIKFQCQWGESQRFTLQEAERVNESQLLRKWRRDTPDETRGMPEVGGEIFMERVRGGRYPCRQGCVFGSRKLRGFSLMSSISL